MLAIAIMVGLGLDSGALIIAKNIGLNVTDVFQTSSFSNIGIDYSNVRIGWKIDSTSRDAKQSEYNVVVRNKDNVVWDSGWVKSNEQTGIKVQNLITEEVYFYKVKVKDQNGDESEFSAEESFETAPLDISGSWIGGSEKLLRKKFVLDQNITNIDRARAYIGSTSMVEARLNGQKVGDLVLAPTKTVPDVSAYYNTYDILPYLIDGDNTLGLYTSEVYPMGGKVKAVYKIYYKDGSNQIILTGPDWRGNPKSPVTKQNLNSGEDFNAKIMKNWDTNAFIEDSTWKDVSSAGVNVSNGSLIVPANSGTYYTKQTFSGNYTIEVNAIIKQTAIGICFGSGNPNSAMWQLSVSGGSAIRAHIPGDWATIKKVANAKIKINTPLVMKIETTGDIVKTYLDGDLVDTTTFAAGQTSGPLGIRSMADEAFNIDYIKVTQNGAIIWEDNFDEVDSTKWNGLSDIKLEPAVTAAKVIEEIKPITITKLSNSYLVDFGKNMSGYVKIKADVPNSVVKVKYSELLNADGTINAVSTFHKPVCSYTVGEEQTEFIPKFFYTGFRYVEVVGYVGELTNDQILACFVSEDLDVTGRFTSSNERLNLIFDMYKQSQQSNIVNLYTDCPQREKGGWSGDASVTKESAALLLNDYTSAENFIRNSMKNIYPNGQPFILLPTPITTVQGSGETSKNDPPWTSAYFVFPYETYMQTGDKYYIEIAYDGLVKIFNYYKTLDTNRDYIVENNTYGDWVGYDNQAGKVSRDFLSAGYTYYSGKLLSQMAEIIGKDHTDLDQYLLKMNEALIKKYYKQTFFSNNVEASNALALDFNLVPQNDINTIIESLVKNVVDSKNTIMTGVLGTKSMYDALSQANQHKVLLDTTINPNKQSFGYMLDNGATTLWEYWDVFGETFNSKLEPKNVGQWDSQNHAMMGGGLGTWVFKGLGGITQTKAAYQEITFRPGVESELTYVNSEIDTVIGKVKSDWTNENGEFNWTINVPANSQGKVILPFEQASRITESGDNIFKKNGNGITYVGVEDGSYVYLIGSGTYNFSVNGSEQSEDSNDFKYIELAFAGLMILASVMVIFKNKKAIHLKAAKS